MADNQELTLACDIQEAMVELGFRPSVIPGAFGGWKLPVRFSSISYTQHRHFIILEVADEQTGCRLYSFALSNRQLLLQLSQRLGKPTRLLQTCDGRVLFVVNIHSDESYS